MGIIRRSSTAPVGRMSAQGERGPREERRLQTIFTFPPLTQPSGHQPGTRAADDLVLGVGSKFEAVSREVYVLPTGKPNSVRKPGTSTICTELFPCFVEACTTPYTNHGSKTKWEAHIGSAHLETISRLVTALSDPVWVCRAWSHASELGGYLSFDDEAVFN